MPPRLFLELVTHRSDLGLCVSGSSFLECSSNHQTPARLTASPPSLCSDFTFSLRPTLIPFLIAVFSYPCNLTLLIALFFFSFFSLKHCYLQPTCLFFFFFSFFSLKLCHPPPPFFFFFFFFFPSKAVTVVYRCFQARGWIREAAEATAIAGSELYLQPTPQLTAMPGPYPAEGG